MDDLKAKEEAKVEEAGQGLVDEAYKPEDAMKLPAQTLPQKLSDLLPDFSIGYGGSDKHRSPVEADHSPEAAEKAGKALWGKTGDPSQAIKPEACVQPDGLGNCYFVAALTSLAKQNPNAIKDMITTNADGTYTVKFPGIDQPITVGKPTPEEIARVHGLSEHGSWPLILQKAFGAYYGGGPGGDLDGTDGGSMFSAGITTLTRGEEYEGVGKRTEMHSAGGWDEILTDAMRNKQVVTISTDYHPWRDQTRDGYTRQHVYSVLDYQPNPQNPSQGLVTIKNPWYGHAPHQITVEQFKANFGQVSISKR